MNVIDTTFFEHAPTSKQWKRIGVEHHHGFVVPLFSLHSSQSCGIGEYLDLIPIIDWCKALGVDIIQLLPLNDTGLQASPYSAISAFALNPINISLTQLPFIENFPLLIDALKAVPKLPHSSKINYPNVQVNKDKFLRLYYLSAGPLVMNSESFHSFINHSKWLKEYALYKTLKDLHQWKSWEQWPDIYQNPSKEFIEELYSLHKDEIKWHSFIQFLCHSQLQHVSEYALKNKVYLLGDIPILIDRDSADVWLHRELFDMDFSAGAPPDMYSQEGQTWGFPLYNWNNMGKEDYKWWVDRLTYASEYYHLYRIDHIVGFFRIWAVPLGMKPRDGHFIPPDTSVWIDHGQKILMIMINHCSMLPIGEDLGTIPPDVRTCLQALGICGTKVLRWEREWNTTREFISPSKYPLASMATVSTHDSETVQLWWQNNPEEAKQFAEFKGWPYVNTLSRNYHQEILWDCHHANSLFHINLLQEYLSLIPSLTWDTLEEERINLPGVVSENNWSYRFRPSVEEMISNPTLNHIIKNIIL